MARGLKTSPAIRKAFKVSGRISKIDKAQRLMLGWASTSTINGQLVTDHDRDRIHPSEMEKALYAAVERGVVLGDMHDRLGVGHLVEAVALTKEKKAAMGLADDGHQGMWVGFRVTDDEMWAAVEKGERPEFSIGGEANRQPAKDEPGAYDLTDIEIHEISGVDAGAGIHVPVVITKERGRGSEGEKMKLHKRLAKLAKTLEKLGASDEGQAIIGKLNDWAATLRKEVGSLAELAQIQEKLTPDEWAMVLEAIQSGVPLAGTPEPVEAALDEEAAAAPPPPAMPPKRKKVDAEDLEPSEIAKSLAEVRKELAAERARSERIEKERRIEKARAFVEKSLPFLPGDPDLHASAIALLDDAIQADGKRLLSVPVELAKHLRETVLKASEAIGTGNVLKTHGANPFRVVTGGDDSGAFEGLTRDEARAELQKRADEIRKNNPKMTEAAAWVEACSRDQRLYELTNSR